MDQSRADGVPDAHPSHQRAGDGSIPISALVFRECSIREAMNLNQQWHSLLPRTVFSNLIRTRRKVCYAADYLDFPIMAAIWTTPIASNRLKDGLLLLELRRLACCPLAPPNACSRMIAWMTRDIRRRWPELMRLISYQDASVHAGTIYSASGWTKADTKASTSEWNGVTGRKRNAPQATGRKIRWERDLTGR